MLDRVRARLGRPRGRVIFAFEGGRGGWPGMGRDLYRSEPAFRSSVDACAQAVGEAGRHVVEAFAGAGYVQPDDTQAARRMDILLLGVIQIALFDLFRDAGIEPDATLGISLGEITSSYAAGALTRAETVAVVDTVARNVGERRLDGLLFMLDADLDTARRLCRNAPRRLDFLGTLSLDTAVTFTTTEHVAENTAYLTDRTRTREITTEWPFHTMRAPYDLEKIKSELSTLAPRRAAIPMYSSISGRDIAPEAKFDALHWHWMIGHPFYYAEAVTAALATEPEAIVHIGAQPMSKEWVMATARHVGTEPRQIDAMRRDDEDGAWREARGLLRRRRRLELPPKRRPQRAHPDALDLTAADVTRDPSPHYERLREAGPAHYLSHHDAWFLLGYEHVRGALLSPATFSSQILDRFDPVLLGADPPGQKPARRSLGAQLAPDAVDALEPFVEDTARSLLAPLLDAVEFDVVADYAGPLTEQVAAHLLGFEDGQLAVLRSAVQNGSFEFRRGGPLDGAGIAARFRELLGDAQDVDDAGAEAVGRLFWIAATETPKQGITAAVLAALQEPELRARIQAERPDREFLQAYVEEVLRRDAPMRAIQRITTEDVPVGDTVIPEGSTLQLCLGAANRDPAKFPEPDRLVLGRERRHLAFGAGVHRCPGAHLARMEMAVALRVLLTTMPQLRAVQPRCAFRWAPSTIMRRLEQLVVAAS